MSPTDTVRTPDAIVDDEDESPSRAELLALVDQMQKDWVTLNEYMNRTASYFSWCGDYEERQRQYNHQMKVLKLQPRSDRDRERLTSPDSYLLPSLKRLVAQDQRGEIKREQEIAQQDALGEQLRHREAELARREERLRQREHEMMNSQRGQRISEGPIIRARLSEPRPAFPPQFERVHYYGNDEPVTIIPDDDGW